MKARRILTLACVATLTVSGSVRATGTPTITFVDTIYPGDYSSYALDAGATAALGDYVYFSAESPTEGGELWRSNGTTTELVKDICPGTSWSNSDELQTIGNYIYFKASDCTHGTEVWRTNGTAAGTTMVADVNPAGNSNPDEFTLLGTEILFSASNNAGPELYKYNGSTHTLVKDINPGSLGGNPVNLITFGDHVYFQANDGTHGGELWKSDGTGAGTTMVKDINPTGPSYPANFLIAGGQLYFTATNGVDGKELWRTDGTEAGTVMVGNIDGAVSGWPDYLVEFQGEVYFRANDNNAGEGPGAELFRTNGPNSIVLAADINPGTGSSSPTELIVFGDRLIFQADDGSSGRELWSFDGSSATQIADILVGGESSSPLDYPWGEVVGDALYFVASADGEQGDLYRLAADESTPQLVAPSAPTSDPALRLSWTNCSSCGSGYITAARGRVFFSMGTYSDGIGGSEFGYLDEPTYVLPPTNGEASALVRVLVFASALTAAAALTLRRGLQNS